jgi:hemerythrin-like domain-containing protein
MTHMMPIGPLMIEHRLIERMIAILAQERARLMEGGDPEPRKIRDAIDFMRNYADHCHHGKEEDILFLQLEGRPLSDGLRGTMERLRDEHQQARRMVRGLERCNQAMVEGDISVRQEMLDLLRDIATLYPKHIELEDRHFFIPVMELFSPEEKDDMLIKFYEFDRMLVHERYRKVVESYEGK